MLGSMQPQQPQLQLCLHIQHVAQGCLALQHRQIQSMGLLPMQTQSAQSACAQPQQEHSQQQPALHAANSSMQKPWTQSRGESKQSRLHPQQGRPLGTQSSSGSSRAGLILQAGSKLHEAWGSSCGARASSRCWIDCSGSGRCYSTRRAAAVSTASQIMDELSKLREGQDAQGGLTPAAVVDRLDKVIIGQEDAKKAVAIAFRNRWRRQHVTDLEMRREITPKNLLLIGPTGCGKTEIARRLAKLAEAPFVKVEATKFTEVGYHGRDVDQIIRDLVETSIALVKKRCKKAAAKIIADAVEQTIISALLPPNATTQQEAELRKQYRAGELDSKQVSIDVPQQRSGPEGPGFVVQGGQMSLSVSLAGVMGSAGPGGPGSSERRSMTVAEARKILEDVEAEAVLPQELLDKEAVRVAEQEGIVFIDEIDKIVNPSGAIRHGSDPSAEGVQRDLLPLIEGSVITTKHGPVATDHILFIASGAFTSAKPSDMMAELQGRLPIRVELRGLTAADFERILTEPECNMIYQQQRLLGCEGVKLEFTPEAIKELAAMAEQLNKELENIGARRLHTVLERLVEDISFEAPGLVEAASAAEDDDQEDGSTAIAQPDGSDKPSIDTAGPVNQPVVVDYEKLSRVAAELAREAADFNARPFGEKLQGYAEDQEAMHGGYQVTHIIDKQQVREKLQTLLKQDDLSKYIL